MYKMIDGSIRYVVLMLSVVIFIVQPASALAQVVPPQTRDDVSSQNSPGLAIRVDVLSNDLPTSDHWDETTVQIVDPSDLTVRRPSYVEPNQGIWSVSTTGQIIFQPCIAVGNPDISCEGPLAGNPPQADSPIEIDYVVQDDAGEWSSPSIVTVKYGTPLAVGLAYVMSAYEDGIDRFEWCTATEQNVAGFNIRAEHALDSRLTDQLIPSLVLDSVVPQCYSFETTEAIDSYYIEVVLLSGETHLQGPFVIGQTYGVLPELEDGGDSDESTRHMIYIPWILANPSQ